MSKLILINFREIGLEIGGRLNFHLRRFRLELKNLVDPFAELGDPGVYTGLVFLGAPDAPADDAGQHEPTVGPLDNHGSATVTLKTKQMNVKI